MVRKFLIRQADCACYAYDFMDAKEMDESIEEFINRRTTAELWWLFFNKVKHYAMCYMQDLKRKIKQ